MRCRATCWTGVPISLLAIAVAMAADPVGMRTKVKPLPKFSQVSQTVLRHFQAQPGYYRGDLITRQQVEPLLAKLEQLGLPLPDAGQILGSVPSNDSFLRNSSPRRKAGNSCRQISAYSHAYDRVDRLSRLPRGQKIVRNLIAGPGGDRMIKYMTTSPGGKSLGDMLSHDPNGAAFNSPTGRIYTLDSLLAACSRATPQR